jgi:hypothetical protein
MVQVSQAILVRGPKDLGPLALGEAMRHDMGDRRAIGQGGRGEVRDRRRRAPGSENIVLRSPRSRFAGGVVSGTGQICALPIHLRSLRGSSMITWQARWVLNPASFAVSTARTMASLISADNRLPRMGRSAAIHFSPQQRVLDGALVDSSVRIGVLG